MGVERKMVDFGIEWNQLVMHRRGKCYAFLRSFLALYIQSIPNEIGTISTLDFQARVHFLG